MSSKPSSAAAASGRPRKRRAEWWLAKVPEFVLEQWEKASSSCSGGRRRPVARLLPADQPADQPATKMRLLLLPNEADAAQDDQDPAAAAAAGTAATEAAEAAAAMPTRLDMLVRPEYFPNSKIEPPALFVLSENKAVDQCSLEAKVSFFADVRPSSASSTTVLAPAYDRLLDARQGRYVAPMKTEHMEMATEHRVMTSSYVNDQSSGMLFKRPTVKRVDRSADRRVRMDESQLRSRIFTLFDDKAYYRLSELVQLTDQPKAYLKEVLVNLCVQHRAGPYMHHYSLKDNFKLTTDAPADDDDEQ